jgi:L-ascorbate metabolism protein UlaG (beta-lactamase superfamily)
METFRKRHIDLPISRKDAFPEEGVHFIWLGQSGFLFAVNGTLVLVDAYLSNYLENNHGDLPYEHGRMVAPPVDEDLYPEIDLVIVTHGHEDHLDPLLMQRLGHVNKKAVFVVPPGCVAALQSCGIQENRIQTVSPGKAFSKEEAIHIEGFPAAHPEADFNPETVWALSYRLHFGQQKLLFAGDTTVYKAWSEWVAKEPFDLCILPVNGRDPEKEANGIVGNMDFHEAIIVALANRTPLLGTHFGMFAFNTIEEESTRQEVVELGLQDVVDLTRFGTLYSFN